MFREAKGIGEQIRVLRVRAGYTQAELAAILKTNQVVISRWETGSAHPAEESLRKLNQVLNFSPMGVRAMRLFKQIKSRGRLKRVKRLMPIPSASVP